MIDDLVRDLTLLRKADSLIAKIWLNVIARRFSLFVFAGLIAVFGLGMTNVAGFYALQESSGPVWAATIIAIADFILAVIVGLVARNAEPGPEIELAFGVRKMAIEAIQTDAAGFKDSIDAFRQEVTDTKDAIAGFVQNPLDVAANKLLIPAAISIIKGLRAKKEQA